MAERKNNPTDPWQKDSLYSISGIFTHKLLRGSIIKEGITPFCGLFKVFEINGNDKPKTLSGFTIDAFGEAVIKGDLRRDNMSFSKTYLENLKLTSAADYSIFYSLNRAGREWKGYYYLDVVDKPPTIPTPVYRALVDYNIVTCHIHLLTKDAKNIPLDPPRPDIIWLARIEDLQRKQQTETIPSVNPTDIRETFEAHEKFVDRFTKWHQQAKPRR